MNKYTSFELSKKLWENGCRLETDVIHNNLFLSMNTVLKIKKTLECEITYPTYDFLWDICIKYAKEFFGDEYIGCYVNIGKEKTKAFQRLCSKHSKHILILFQDNISQKEIEKYIWENCLFNPKNKEKK